MPASNARALGRRIAEARAQKGLSLRDAADAAGVHFSFLSKLENGEYASPQPQRLRRIANALDLDIEELVELTLAPEKMPELPRYLRVKYDLPSPAVAELTAFFKGLKDKYDVGDLPRDDDV